jgi:hypothetical protein
LRRDGVDGDTMLGEELGILVDVAQLRLAELAPDPAIEHKHACAVVVHRVKVPSARVSERVSVGGVRMRVCECGKRAKRACTGNELDGLGRRLPRHGGLLVGLALHREGEV